MLKPFVSLAAAFLLVACSEDTVPLNELFTCSDDQAELLKVAELLEDRDIPFAYETVDVDRVSYTRDGRKSVLPQGATCIFYSHQYNNVVNDVQKQVIGDFPSIWGRSASWDGRNSDLVRKLSNHGIATTKHVYRGKEWIAWSLEDAEEAEDILGFDESRKQLFKEQRSKMYAPGD